MKSYRLASIGFIVFLSMAVLFFGIRFLQNESFQKSTFTFKVVFNDLQGLDISDDVRMLGKKIGRVSGYGWSLGYVGGLISLILALMFFIFPEVSFH